LAIAPTPIVALNRAVAVAEVKGSEAALALVDELAADLADYHLFHAIRADLLRRSGRSAEALVAYDAATARSKNAADREFLLQRRSELNRLD
jgi:RNA polymerase sigma-70 factor (ECF subfamily)